MERSTSWREAGGAVTQLAMGQDSLVSIAVDVQHLVWATSTGYVVALNKAGGIPAVIDSKAGAGSEYAPINVLSDGANVYVLRSNGNIDIVSLSGGPTRTLFTNQYIYRPRRPSYFSQSASRLFYAFNTQFTLILKKDESHQTGCTLAGNGSETSAMTDNGIYFYADNGASGFVQYTPYVRPWGWGCPNPNTPEPPEQTLWSDPTESLGTLARGHTMLDGDHVYWFGTLGLERIPTCGARAVGVLAARPLSVIPVGKMATDTDHVYWTNGSTIVRARK
jgi:hypothetical protein